MKTLAICFYGLSVVDGSTLVQKYSHVFDNYVVTIFINTNDNVFKSMWLVTHQKRKFEIDTKKDFDVCLLLCTDNIELLDHISIPILSDNKLYYTSGYIKLDKMSVGIKPSGLVSDSWTIDRISEFYVSKTIDVKYLKNDTIEERFFYFVKSLKITTECINYENSSMFKRTT